MQLHPLNHNEHPSVQMYVQGYDPYAQLQVYLQAFCTVPSARTTSALHTL